jgi:large repetitive protein
MVFSWWRGLLQSASRQRSRSRKGRPARQLRYRATLELLEGRLVPAATITLPTSGFSGTVGTTVMNFPVDIANLSDGTHVGLSSATLAVTFPTGVFNFPVGGSLAASDVSLGSIPETNGGASNWTVSANSPADGVLNISLTAQPGDTISSTAGGSLVNINFPVSSSFNPSSPTPETIQVVSSSGSFHTQVVGSNGTYTTSSLGLPASGTITIDPSTQTPPTVTSPQNYSTEANQTLNQAAPGLLTGANDPQGQTITVNKINGAPYTIGTAFHLSSGAKLTVQSDGSFTYAPASDFIGSDSFTFTVIDTGGRTSSAGTVNVAVAPTLHLSPAMFTGMPGNTVDEQVILANPNQAGTGGLASFDLALTYTGGTLTITGITPGPNLPHDWSFAANTNNPGVITYAGFGNGSGSDVVTSSGPLVLATIHITLNSVPSQTVPLLIVPSVTTSGGTTNTALSGPTSTSFAIHPPLSNSFIDGVDANIDISTQPITLSPDTLPDGTVGTHYSQAISATGGNGSIAFSETGVLPPGLTLSNTGVIAGTPTATGSYNFTVTATDSAQEMGSKNYSLNINGSGITISPSTLSGGNTGHPYSQTLTPTGGTGPYTFTSSGTLPTGLTLSPSGVLSGTPTTTGSFNWSANVIDSASTPQTGTQPYTVTISAPPMITTTSLPNGDMGAPYNQTIHTSGGTAPLTFSSTTVPPGLTLNSTSGVLSGTPTTAAGSFSFTVTATDAIGASASQLYTVTIHPAVAITTTTLPSGRVNVTYNQTISASGGSGTYSFTRSSGTLPTGLTLSSTGVLGGTPTAQGSFSFAVTATDTLGGSDTKNYSVTINPPFLITLSPSTLPNGDDGIPYNQTITATGGQPPYTFAVTSGTLPTGLTLSTTGVLSGTPTATGTFSFTVTATDSTPTTGLQNYTVTISPQVAITTTSLPNGQAMIAYSQTISTTGGTAPLTFTSTGTLPTGLTLNSSSGVLSGTPTTFGNYSFTVTATDSLGSSASQDYTMDIAPAPIVLSPTTLPNWTVQQPGYNQIISATGGTGSFTFTTTSGTLPTGLTLSTTGVLSGTPTDSGTFHFTVTATDSSNDTGNRSYTVTINPTLVITTTTLPGGQVSVAYDQTVSATGGTTPLTFTATGTPPGLTLSSAGVLSGTPTTPGTYQFTVSATDAAGATSPFQSFPITIAAAPIVISPTTLPNWTVNQPGYTQSITATGGVPPFTFTTTAGTLPSGLSLSTSGVISGTPTATGTFSFTITATDSTSTSQSQAYTVTINPGVSITTSSLANWTVNHAGYSQTIAATGGTGTKTFTTTGGTLPTGLTLSSTGVLSGTPSATGSFNFTVTATDTTGASSNHSYTVTVNPAVTITTTTLPNWTVNQAGYNQVISATGGTGTLTFTTSSGTLPTGLTVSTAGVVSGTPTATGSFNFTVTATDSTGAAGSQAYTVSVNPAITITTSTLPNWTVNHSGYSQTITATGGTGSLTFSSTGSLPTGLSLSSTGVLSGTPTAPGSFSFTVTATDTTGATGAMSYTVTINPALALSPSSLPAGTVGTAYNQTITASGGTGSVSLAVSNISGSIPGLIVPTSGTGTLVISGTPTASGTESFTVTATDVTGATTATTYTITVSSVTPTGKKADIIGMVEQTGQWFVGASNGSAFATTFWDEWSPNYTWVDVMTGDFTGNGTQDIVARALQTGQWYVGVPDGTGKFTTSLWDRWDPSYTWVDVQVGKFDGSGRDGIVGRALQTGQWFVASSTGTQFSTRLWDAWDPSYMWADVHAADFTGDGKTDIVGRALQTGQWFVGASNGSAFATTEWGVWSPQVTWINVKVGDLTGDGKADLIGMVKETGAWFAGISTGSSFTTAFWDQWNPSFTWIDVEIGDLTGDGKADIIGMAKETGQWFAGISNGSALATSFWDRWDPSFTWVDVQLADFTGDGKMDLIGRAQETGQWFVGVSDASTLHTSLWDAWSTAVNWNKVVAGKVV